MATQLREGAGEPIRLRDTIIALARRGGGGGDGFGPCGRRARDNARELLDQMRQPGFVALHGADFLALPLDVARQPCQHAGVFAFFVFKAFALVDLFGGDGFDLGGFGGRFVAQRF